MGKAEKIKDNSICYKFRGLIISMETEFSTNVEGGGAHVFGDSQEDRCVSKS